MYRFCISILQATKFTQGLWNDYTNDLQHWSLFVNRKACYKM